MSLIALVYVSFATHDMSDQELKDILTTARNFNSQNQVTGMLLYRDGFFIQSLEGEASIVEALYDKIAQDSRHKSALVVHKNNITERSFTQWSMGFNKITDEQLLEQPSLNDFLIGRHDMTYFTSQPSRATTLLEIFRNRSYF